METWLFTLLRRPGWPHVDQSAKFRWLSTQQQSLMGRVESLKWGDQLKRLGSSGLKYHEVIPKAPHPRERP
jgi:hypothetical protein